MARFSETAQINQPKSMTISPPSKSALWDYFIVVARYLLAYVFLNYGFSKLTAGQFGISETELMLPVKDVSLFKLSWYLFDQQPFKAFVGISQIICGVLLIVHRTALLGAFMFLPIVSVILVIDLTYMPRGLAYGFAWRLSFYLLLDFLILWSYKSSLQAIWKAAFVQLNTEQRFPKWAYLLTPFFAVLLELLGAMPKIATNLLIHPTETLEALSSVPELILSSVKKFLN